MTSGHASEMRRHPTDERRTEHHQHQQHHQPASGVHPNARTQLKAADEEATLRDTTRRFGSDSLLRPSHHLSAGSSQTPPILLQPARAETPLDANGHGHHSVHLYSFPQSPFAGSAEAKARDPFATAAALAATAAGSGGEGRPPPDALSNGIGSQLSEGVLLHSFSRPGRAFHDSSLRLAALENRRVAAQQEAQRAKQQAAWERQLTVLMESNTHKQGAAASLGAMRTSVLTARDQQAATVGSAKAKWNPSGHAFLGGKGVEPWEMKQAPSSALGSSTADSIAPARSRPAGRSQQTSQVETDPHQPGGGYRTQGEISDDSREESAPPPADVGVVSPGGLLSHSSSTSTIHSPPIALRRSRAQQKLAAAAIQRQREGFLSGRPRNPFEQPARSSLADQETLLHPPLSHAAQQSRQAYEQAREVDRVQRNSDLAAAQLQEQNAPDPFGLNATSALAVAGIDSRLYRPPSTFSAEAQEVLHNPYYTEPSPLADEHGVEPGGYLKRKGIGDQARREIEAVEQRVHQNLSDSFQRNLQQQQHQRQPSASASVGHPQSSTFSSIFTALRLNGVLDSASARERTDAEIFISSAGGGAFLSIGDGVGGGAIGSAGISDAALKRQLMEGFGSRSPAAHRSGPSAVAPTRHPPILQAHDHPAYQHLEWTKLVGNNHSAANLEAASSRLGGPGDPSKEANPELARLRRSLPYAVRLSFRSSRIRVTAMHLAWLFGTLPGCTRVDDILLSPDMRHAYVAFQYCRYQHHEATLHAPAEVTGGRAGVECDGIEAVRMHLRILAADMPTPYLTAHRAHTSDLTGAQSNSATAHLTLQGHAELRVLLRFLLAAGTSVTEWSQVQLEALKKKWHSESTSGAGGQMPHTRDTDVLGPSETLPTQEKTRKAGQEEQEEGRRPATSSNATTAAAAGSGATAAAAEPSLMSLDTSHMFSPRVNSGYALVPAARGGSSSSSSRAAPHAPGGHTIARPAGVPRKRRGKQPYGAPAELEWPEGMFAHVVHAQAQEAALSGGSQTARRSAPPLPSNFLGAPSSARGPSSHHERLRSAANVVGAANAHYPPRPPSLAIALPSSSFTGLPPSSLSVAPSAPSARSHAVSMHIETRDGIPTAVRRKVPEPTLAERTATREPTVYARHPSSAAGAPARVHDPRVTTADPRFFRSEGDMSSLRLLVSHPSAAAPLHAESEASWMGHVLSAQADQSEREEKEHMEMRYRAAQHAPVRTASGEVSRANARHRRRIASQSQGSAASAAASQPVGHLTWSLTEQLEAREADRT